MDLDPADGPYDPAKATFRRALDLVACFLGPEIPDRPDTVGRAEFEKILNDDPEPLYSLAVFAAGVVALEAERSGEDPLDVLHYLGNVIEQGYDAKG